MNHPLINLSLAEPPLVLFIPFIHLLAALPQVFLSIFGNAIPGEFTSTDYLEEVFCCPQRQNKARLLAFAGLVTSSDYVYLKRIQFRPSLVTKLVLSLNFSKKLSLIVFTKVTDFALLFIVIYRRKQIYEYFNEIYKYKSYHIPLQIYGEIKLYLKLLNNIILSSIRYKFLKIIKEIRNATIQQKYPTPLQNYIPCST